VPNASVKDQAVSEWYRACSAAGVRTYPYGMTYDASTCNGCESQGICGQQAYDRTRPSGSLVGCKGGVSDQLLDMSGNVQEWENSCIGSSGRLDDCAARGGAWPNNATDLQCTSAIKWKRDFVAGEIGVRCCSP
jgi:formylglycine-generating enzyme required for sulfatase activity